MTVKCDSVQLYQHNMLHGNLLQQRSISITCYMEASTNRGLSASRYMETSTSRGLSASHVTWKPAPTEVYQHHILHGNLSQKRSASTTCSMQTCSKGPPASHVTCKPAVTYFPAAGVICNRTVRQTNYCILEGSSDKFEAYRQKMLRTFYIVMIRPKFRISVDYMRLMVQARLEQR
jgi:hypothetical protein